MHGGRTPEDAIDFSISINPYKPEWIDDVFERAEKLSSRYVYWEHLEQKLSELVKNDVSVTAGATEAIYLIGIHFLRELESVVIPKPTYSEYERIARFFGCRVVEVPLSNLESIGDRLSSSSAIFFCNPNNPTGRYYSPKELKPLVDAVEDSRSIMFLDEAFMDFVEGYRSVDSENVVKIRTFTKSYGLPGIRVGYVINFEEVKEYRMPWSIGSVGYAFLEKLIEDKFSFLKQSMPKIWREKRKFESKLGVKGDANFFLMYMPGAVEFLKSKGIYVRDCSSFGLDGHIRFSIRLPEENDLLIKNLIEVMG
ncbi:L-threonine O-3-phosphate decarboxylase [Archaeoglobus sulfaticallidus PM70-1]|uniref:histidinol-phosphate transaminase n=1 Tax=Archaeoglobus sulfaticallidus PM70-1 TaxID=387631 RepID=N0BNJ2_9EURY|nr:aminotransferase class I/II-fold pyridoxal phosphate-dependent enzyme [Archaeoglobus sulfaticallidus]AGK62236.1 L-threonine O-3-phosphate decarboxylase [Archaeoglobus sulfaticallidus PM70-1]